MDSINPVCCGWLLFDTTVAEHCTNSSSDSIPPGRVETVDRASSSCPSSLSRLERPRVRHLYGFPEIGYVS